MAATTLPTSGAAVTFNTQRTRAYLLKLPLFTRATVLIIVLTWVLTLAGKSWNWDVKTWGALIPDEIGFATCRSSSALGVLVWGCEGLAGVEDLAEGEWNRKEPQAQTTRKGKPPSLGSSLGCKTCTGGGYLRDQMAGLRDGWRLHNLERGIRYG